MPHYLNNYVPYFSGSVLTAILFYISYSCASQVGVAESLPALLVVDSPG